MKKNKERSNFRFIKVKEIMEMFDCSYGKAVQLRRDVSFSFLISVNLVTYEHFMRYLNLHHDRPLV